MRGSLLFMYVTSAGPDARPGGQAHFPGEDGGADMADGIEVLQQPVEFFKIKMGDHHRVPRQIVQKFTLKFYHSSEQNQSKTNRFL